MAPLIYNGIVTKIGKMSKTITVSVTRQIENKKFQMSLARTKNFLVHDEDHLAHVEDRVSIVHGIDYSKRKHFRLHTIDRRGKDPEAYTKAEEWTALEAKLRQRQDQLTAENEAKERKRKNKARLRAVNTARLVRGLGAGAGTAESGSGSGSEASQ